LYYQINNMSIGGLFDLKKKLATTGKTLLTVVLDETGSMIGQRDAMISGFNEFMDSQQDKALGECLVTLIQFNSGRGVRTVYKDKPIADVPRLTDKDYQPDDMTPLYDAIAQGIKDTADKYSTADAVLSKMVGKPVSIAPLVIFLVMTDGEENSSKQYKREDIFKMIEEKKAAGWSFVYLGSNQDSWQNAAPLGFAAGNVTNYVHAQSVAAFSGVAQSLTSARHAYTTAVDNVTASAGTCDTVEYSTAVEDLTKTMSELRANYWKGKKDITS
jgi:hypothetical protein